MKSFMNMFMEKIKSSAPVFTVNVVENGATYYGIYCRKAWVDADIVFGCEDYDMSLSSVLQTVAIVKGDNVILIDKATYLYDEELPENVKMFADVSEELEKELNDEYFYPWFDTIQAEKIQPADKAGYVQARRILFGLDEYRRPVGITLTSEGCFQLLIGAFSRDDVFKNKFTGKEDDWRKEKAYDDMLKRLITEDKDKAVSAAEFKFAEAVNLLIKRNCRFVTAEFKRNGRCASAKVNPRKLIGRLAMYYDLCADNFESLKAYGEVRRALNADRLECDDIYRLSYGKDVVYTKEVL